MDEYRARAEEQIQRKKWQRQEQAAEAPGLMRDAFEILNTRTLPDGHAQEMLQLFVSTSPTVAKSIGQRFTIGACMFAESIAYAREVVQNAIYQAAAKHEYVAGTDEKGRKFIDAKTPEGKAAFSDSINTPTALRFMTNIIRHAKNDPVCADLSYAEISGQAANAIAVLARMLSSLSANQVQKFMEYATQERIYWTVNTAEYTYDPGFLVVEKDGSRIRIRPTEKFHTYWELAKKMELTQWYEEGTVGCPMFATKGNDDAYRLLLNTLRLALKKIEDVKAGRPDAPIELDPGSPEVPPEKYLLKDILSPRAHEITDEQLVAVAKLVQHTGKTLVDVKVGDLSQLQIQRYRDGDVIVTNMAVQGPSWKEEFSSDVAAVLDTVNKCIHEKWPDRFDLALSIQDVD